MMATYDIWNSTAAAEMSNVSVVAMGTEAPQAPSTSGHPSMLTRYIFETALCMPISILGIIGNILASVVLIRQRPRLSTTILLLSLAADDSLILLSTILLRSLRYLAYYHNVMDAYLAHYHSIFLVIYPLVYFIRMFNIWLTVLLTIDRVIAVCKPLHTSRICTISKAYRNIIIICICSFAFSIPRLFEFKYDSDNPFKFTSTNLLKNQTYTIGYRIITFSLFMYIIPMSALVILNAILLRTIKKADLHRTSMNKSSSSRSNSQSITAIVVTVVSITILCNCAALIAHILWSLHEMMPRLKHLETYRRYMSLVANLLVTINSALNFVVYCACSRNFRLTFRRTFRCHRGTHIYRLTIKDSDARSNATVTSSLFRFSTKKKSLVTDNIPMRKNIGHDHAQRHELNPRFKS